MGLKYGGQKPEHRGEGLLEKPVERGGKRRSTLQRVPPTPTPPPTAWEETDDSGAGRTLVSRQEELLLGKFLEKGKPHSPYLCQRG